MAEKVDLSLDDIIKMNKNKNKKRVTGRGGKAGGLKPKKRLQNLGVRSKIINKGGPKNMSPRKESTLLHVSNLHFNVSNEDIRELFAEVGPIRKATVHYDKSGRSLGTAEVIFSTRDAAIKAIKKYHNLPLDGRPMNISLVPSKTNNSSPNKMGVQRRKPGQGGVFKRQQHHNTNNNKNLKKRGGPPMKQRPGFARGKPQGRREPKKQVTAEELNADLEAYTTNAMDTQ